MSRFDERKNSEVQAPPSLQKEDIEKITVHETVSKRLHVDKMNKLQEQLDQQHGQYADQLKVHRIRIQVRPLLPLLNLFWILFVSLSLEIINNKMLHTTVIHNVIHVHTHTHTVTDTHDKHKNRNLKPHLIPSFKKMMSFVMNSTVAFPSRQKKEVFVCLPKRCQFPFFFFSSQNIFFFYP